MNGFENGNKMEAEAETWDELKMERVEALKKTKLLKQY